jgi:hypothetical protein
MQGKDIPERAQVVYGYSVQLYVLGGIDFFMCSLRLHSRRRAPLEHGPSLVLQDKEAHAQRIGAELLEYPRRPCIPACIMCDRSGIHTSWQV